MADRTKSTRWFTCLSHTNDPTISCGTQNVSLLVSEWNIFMTRVHSNSVRCWIIQSKDGISQQFTFNTWSCLFTVQTPPQQVVSNWPSCSPAAHEMVSSTCCFTLLNIVSEQVARQLEAQSFSRSAASLAERNTSAQDTRVLGAAVRTRNCLIRRHRKSKQWASISAKCSDRRLDPLHQSRPPRPAGRKSSLRRCPVPPPRTWEVENGDFWSQRRQCVLIISSLAFVFFAFTRQDVRDPRNRTNRKLHGRVLSVRAARVEGSICFSVRQLMFSPIWAPFTRSDRQDAQKVVASSCWFFVFIEIDTETCAGPRNAQSFGCAWWCYSAGVLFVCVDIMLPLPPTPTPKKSTKRRPPPSRLHLARSSPRVYKLQQQRIQDNGGRNTQWRSATQVAVKTSCQHWIVVPSVICRETSFDWSTGQKTLREVASKTFKHVEILYFYGDKTGKTYLGFCFT